MKRFPLPDLLKGFAVFMIIPVHIIETFINAPGRESLFGKIVLFLGGPFLVPIFMTVMGYFISISKKSAKQTIFRGLAIFGLGLLLNIGLNFNLLLKIWFEGWLYDPLEYILGVDIFYFAGLSIIFLALIKTTKKGQVWIVAGLIIIIAVSTSFMNKTMMVPERNYILPFIAGKYSWSYFPIFPWLAYPLMGYLFQKSESRINSFFEKRKWILASASIIILILVFALGKQGFQITVNLREYYHHTFFYMLWAFGVIILWAQLMKLIVQKFEINPLILSFRWLGKNITVFYIIQWLIIGNIATAIYQTKSLNEFPIWFTAIFITTVGLTWMTEKIFKKVKN